MTSSTLSHHVGAHTSPFTGEASCEIDTSVSVLAFPVCTLYKARATAPAVITGQLSPLLTKQRLTSFIPFVVCLSNVHGDIVGISNLLNNDFAGNHHSSGSPI